MPAMRPCTRLALSLVLPTIFVGCAGEATVDDGADWPHYARDLAATKYSPLDQISAENVGDLEVAWVWESADYRLGGEHAGASVNANYQATPIKIGDRLYTSTNMGQAVALDPGTGEELWRYDPMRPGFATSPEADRTVASHTGVTVTRRASCSARVSISSRSTQKPDSLIRTSAGRVR